MNKEDDNFYKKYQRRSFWIANFFIIPVLLYLLIWPLSQSIILGLLSAIIGFMLYTSAFFYLGIHKNFW